MQSGKSIDNNYLQIMESQRSRPFPTRLSFSLKSVATNILTFSSNLLKRLRHLILLFLIVAPILLGLFILRDKVAFRSFISEKAPDTKVTQGDLTIINNEVYFGDDKQPGYVFGKVISIEDNLIRISMRGHKSEIKKSEISSIKRGRDLFANATPDTSESLINSVLEFNDIKLGMVATYNYSTKELVLQE